MYKTRYILFALTAMVLFIMSCSGDDIIGESNHNDTCIETLSKEDVFNLLFQIGIDEDLCSEIHTIVEQEVKLGNDENLVIRNVLVDNQVSRSKNPSILRERLLALSKKTRSNSSSCNSNLIENLKNSNVLIYWPYSEDWDGKELPTLVVAPENEDVEECQGWILVNEFGEMKTYPRIIDEDYAMKHPVWIIKNAKEVNNDWEYSVAPLLTRSTSSTDQNTPHPWQVMKMRVTHQYDTWIAGGSEIDIQVAYPVLTGYVTGLTKYRINFTRKEINDESWKSLTDIYLNTNWRPEQINNFLVISESDGGKKTIEIPVSVKYRDPEKRLEFDASTKIEIKNLDEEIAQLCIDRDFMLTKDTLYFDNKNVSMLMPIQNK